MKELWDECVNWLVASGVLDVSLGQRLTKPADLAIILRDGVLLCELALKLAPGCIDRSEMFLQYEENQRSPFMRAKNISLFLDVCRSQFNLTQLFNSNDLYDLEDFGRVLHVISLLSHSEQAASGGLRPFPETTQSTTDESIYCNLRDEVDKAGQTALSFSPFDDAQNAATASTRPSSAFESEEDHYGFIGTRQENRNQRERLYDTIVTRGASGAALFRHSLVPARYLDYQPTNKRGHCIKELLDTEIRYCDMLERFIENFYNKLRNRIGADDMEAIFINIKDIHRLHLRFLTKLVPAVLNALELASDAGNGGDRSIDSNVETKTADELDPNLHISDVFCRFKLDFIPYAQYCSRLKSSTRYIDELGHSQPDIRKYIAELNSQVQSQFNLRDLLAIPFQRLLKYPLLLKEMMDASADILEQQRLDEALEAMRDISNYCNEMKRDYEKTEVISIIERSIVCGETRLPTPFVEWCGRLLQDGVVRMADHDDGTSNRPKQRYAFLFEKNLIVCKQKSNGFYEFRRAYIISEYELPDGDGDQPPAATGRTNSISRKLTATLFDNTSLTLVRRGYASLFGADPPDASPFVKRASLSSLNVSVVGSPGSVSSASATSSTASVQMLFKSSVQKESWRKMLKTAIELNNPPIAAERGHSLLYKTYTKATECSICKKLLAGKFYQGYHCSGCSCNLHLECCKHLQFCANRRRLPPSAVAQRGTFDRHASSAADFHHTRTRSHSAIHFGAPLSGKFQAGDLVVATRTVVSSIGDTCRLSFNAGDLVEIVDVQPDTGAITACINGRPDRVGLVSADCIERTSETLRKMAERDRRSAGALNVLLTASATVTATPAPSASATVSTSSTAAAPLVSQKIIQLSEERGVRELNDQPWYFGQCTRADADRLLAGAEDGTFLVRYSEDSSRYAISLRYEGIQKHIRIEVCPDTGMYYLCDWRFFNTIPELVAYYRKTNLHECFPKVHAVLAGTPLKDVLFRALNAYERHNHNDHYLTLRPDDVVTVLRTCTDHQGWWLGRINDRIGYFPLSYVHPFERTDNNQNNDGSEANNRSAGDGTGYGYAANGMRHEIRAQMSADGIRPPPPYLVATAGQFPTPQRPPIVESRRHSAQMPPMITTPTSPAQMSSMRTEFPSSSTGQPVTICAPSTNSPAPATNGQPQKYLSAPLTHQEFAVVSELKRHLHSDGPTNSTSTLFDATNSPADLSADLSPSTSARGSSKFPVSLPSNEMPANDYETAADKSHYTAALSQRPTVSERYTVPSESGKTSYYVNHSVSAPSRIENPNDGRETNESEDGSVV